MLNKLEIFVYIGLDFVLENEKLDCMLVFIDDSIFLLEIII